VRGLVDLPDVDVLELARSRLEVPGSPRALEAHLPERIGGVCAGTVREVGA
jgi:hypothetical protein